MIAFPEYAKVGKIVAKEHFYGSVDTATKNLFQNEIARIIWEYKLAPDTINLPAKKWLEVEVFRITLKNNEIPEKVLKTIDSAIPYPILFIIEKGSIEKAVICYKQQNTKDGNSAKVDTYFSTDWNDDKLNNIRIEGLDIDAVFENFIRQIAGDRLNATHDPTRSPDIPTTIQNDIDKMKERERILAKIEALKRKQRAEPSIGKKQTIAEEIFNLKEFLKTL